MVRPRSAYVLTGALVAILAPAALDAQIPYTVFDAGTQVGSLDFTFPQGRTFSDDRLKSQMALGAPGLLSQLHGALSVLPFVSQPPRHSFTPLMLQRDVARLRRFYAEHGFLHTRVRYRVAYDAQDDRVAVHMVVDEGRAVTVRSFRITTPDGGSPARLLPAALETAWQHFVRGHRDVLGTRITEERRAHLVGDVLDWWRNHGWAFVQARAETPIDSAAAAMDLTIRLRPGPRTRIGRIEIEGNHGVSDHVIRQALPFHEGEWFSARRLADGQRLLFGLDLFRLVLVGTPSDQPRDSTVDVRVRVEESPPRLFTGDFGYVSSGGGLTGHAEWEHRNFFGGARSLRVTASAQTGLLSTEAKPAEQYGLSVTYRRPFTFNPLMTANLAPYGRYEDNLVDRSWEVGEQASLIYQLGRSRYLTLQHTYSARHVLNYRLGSASALDLAALRRLAQEGALDSLSHHVTRSVFSLSATLGRYDPTSTSRALQARPSVEVTAPAALNTAEFTRLDVPVVAFLPLGSGFALAWRGRFGRVYPFGKTLQGDSTHGVLQAARLHDVLLTAGGTGSVRGWGNGLLGPKFPDLTFSTAGGVSTAHVATDAYVPTGGLARATSSLELRTPFPGLSDRFGLYAFLDAGRVWTRDERFRGQDPYGQQHWFYGTGAGFDISTIVGPIRVSVGYKLNPSPLDLRDPRQVFQAISEGRPISSVPTRWTRRFHIHIALGQAF